MGRPTKLTPEIQETVVKTIGGGAYQCTACERAGIGVSTFQEWMTKGAEGHEPYAAFAEAVKKAEADAETARIARIAKAGVDGDWKADAWYLERRYPERWARREHIRAELTGDGGGPVKHEHTVSALERLSGAIARLAAAGAETAGDGEPD